MRRTSTSRRSEMRALKTRYQPYAEISAGLIDFTETMDESRRWAEVARPTEEAVIMREGIEQRTRRLANIDHRIARRGYVYLTAREVEAVKAARRVIAFKVPYAERRRYLCSALNCNTDWAYKLVRTATAVMSYMEIKGIPFRWDGDELIIPTN